LIQRLLRLIFPEYRVVVREVEGPAWPKETRITDNLEDIRFEPATPNVHFEDATFRRVDLSSLHFLSFYADDCRFVECDFSNISIDWLPFASGGSLFRDCSFRGARIGDFGDVRLERCDFTGANLSGWFTWAADIVQCRFGGHLSGVVFNGMDSTESKRNEFVGNDFRDADLDDVSFRFGIDLDKQLLPESAEYLRLRDIRKRVKSARRQVRDWPRDEAREQAEKMLELFEDVYANEDDVFTKREFVLEFTDDREVASRVVELLELGR
jgi:hypothetical protein